jgi:hypothetical protein
MECVERMERPLHELHSLQPFAQRLPGVTTYDIDDLHD